MKARDLYQEFEQAVLFKHSINLYQDVNRSVLFENGKQWNMSEDLKEFPKITLNIIKQIGKVRKSNIMQNEYGYLVSSNNVNSIKKIQDFLKYLANKLNLRKWDLKALNDDYTKGTAIGYFYWDAEKRGFLRKSGGELRYEIIDIRNFVVANPYLQDIQNQEWVAFVKREKVGAIKAKYNVTDIQPDANIYTSGTEKEPIGRTPDDEYTNVYTKFYRNWEGQVFFVIFTKDKILKKPTPLNPYYEGTDSQEAPATTSLMDEKDDFEERYKDKDIRSDYVWTLYPFCRLCLNERDNCFYGLPITLEYIDAQKSINNHFSVYDKALQDNVLGGFVYRRGVLDETEVTTETGQMIPLDTLPNEPIQNVFGRLPVANIPNDSHNYSAHLVMMTRQVAGASNVQLGMADFAGQSGRQTQLLLERARENSSDNAMLFNEFKREQAYIMFLFAKFFYDNEDFTIVEHGFKENEVRQYTNENAFRGLEYLDDDVIIDIRVGSAPSFSEYTNLELLGLMVQSGQLPVEAYISMLPEGFISNKQELLNILQNNSQKVIMQLQQQLEQAKMVIEQMNSAYQQARKDLENVETILNDNMKLRSMMADVTANAVRRVQQLSEQARETTEDMTGLLKIIQKRK